MNTVMYIGILLCLGLVYTSALPSVTQELDLPVPIAAEKDLETQESRFGGGGWGRGGGGWGGRGGGWGGRGGGWGGRGGGWGGRWGVWGGRGGGWGGQGGGWGR